MESNLCEVCELAEAVVECDDGLWRCDDCCIDDGYDPQTGKPVR
jgi:ribosomal protein L37AE/L43A